MQHLVDRAAAFTEAKEPGEAFFAYLDVLVDEGKSDQDLVDALAGNGFDIATAIPDSAQQFMALLEDLLTRAQQAGAVRSDIGVKEVKLLLVGCQAMQRSRHRIPRSRRPVARTAGDRLPAERAGQRPANAGRSRSSQHRRAR